MNLIHPVRVKVACIRNPEEARRAVSFGAAAIGMAAETAAGGPHLTQTEITEIVASVPKSIGTFLMTTRRSPVELAELARSAGVNTIQLWDVPEPDAYSYLRSAVPGISIVQSIPVVDEGAIKQAVQVSSRVDALLLADCKATELDPSETDGLTSKWALDATAKPSLKHFPPINRVPPDALADVDIDRMLAKPWIKPDVR